MKKFQEAKAPLGQLKFRMQIKADKQTSYKSFQAELEQIISEQTKFQDKVEYLVAVAESLDPLQDLVFLD